MPLFLSSLKQVDIGPSRRKNTLFQALQQTSSVEDISKVVLVEQLNILFTRCAKAIKQVVRVGLAELGRVAELGAEVVDVVVLLDGLDHVALAFQLEKLLGDHYVSVVDFAEEVAKVTLRLVQVGWVAEGTLVVGHGPGGRGHHAKVVVLRRVQATRERHL